MFRGFSVAGSQLFPALWKTSSSRVLIPIKGFLL